MQITRQLHDALQSLNMLNDFVVMVQATQSYDEALKLLESFKLEAKQRHKEQAIKHHPDKGGSVEKMQQINSALDQINKIDIHRPQPRPVFQVIHVTYSGYGGFSSNSTTSTSTTSFSGW